MSRFSSPVLCYTENRKARRGRKTDLRRVLPAVQRESGLCDSLAAADTGKESVIWTTYPLTDVSMYYTFNKKSFCVFIKVNGEWKAKYKRLLNIKLSVEAMEGWRKTAFEGRFINGNDHSRMKHTTPGSINSLLPTMPTQKISVSTTTLPETILLLREGKEICCHHPKRLCQIERGHAVSGQCPENGAGCIPGLFWE